MTNKKLILTIIISIIITTTIFLLPISLSSITHCRCGGCCIGCPGDCNTIGTPLAIYYWGTNELSGETISQISTLGLITDIIILTILIFFIHKIIYKKHS